MSPLLGGSVVAAALGEMQQGTSFVSSKMTSVTLAAIDSAAGAGWMLRNSSFSTRNSTVSRCKNVELKTSKTLKYDNFFKKNVCKRCIGMLPYYIQFTSLFHMPKCKTITGRMRVTTCYTQILTKIRFRTMSAWKETSNSFFLLANRVLLWDCQFIAGRCQHSCIIKALHKPHHVLKDARMEMFLPLSLCCSVSNYLYFKLYRGTWPGTSLMVARLSLRPSPGNARSFSPGTTSS